MTHAERLQEIRKKRYSCVDTKWLLVYVDRLEKVVGAARWMIDNEFDDGFGCTISDNYWSRGELAIRKALKELEKE